MCRCTGVSVIFLQRQERMTEPTQHGQPAGPHTALHRPLPLQMRRFSFSTQKNDGHPLHRASQKPLFALSRPLRG